MNFQLGAASASTAASPDRQQPINFPSVRIENRFLDDGEKLHSDLVGLSLSVFDDKDKEKGEEEEEEEGEEEVEEEAAIEVEDLEDMEEQEVFSLTTTMKREV